MGWGPSTYGAYTQVIYTNGGSNIQFSTIDSGFTYNLYITLERLL